MKFVVSSLCIPLSILLSTLQSNAYAQVCINKYTSIKLKGTTYDTITASTVSSTDEILSAGNLYDYNGAGHIAKFSAKGTPIWSYQYSLAYFNFYPPTFFKAVHFSDITPASDGGYLVAGNVDQSLSPFGNPPPVKKYALAAKLDKFGKVIWSKVLSNAAGDVSFPNIFETSDGAFILYMATDNGKKILPGEHSYGRVFKIDSQGNVKWSTLLFSYLFDAGGLGIANKRGITQLASKNIIIGDVVHKTDPVNGSAIKEGNIHFMELDYATGKINWETSYEYPSPPSDTSYTPDILNVTELPGGELSFITTLYLPATPGAALVKKGVNILTSRKGAIENVLTYAPADGSSCRITGVAKDKNNGNRTLLIDKSGIAMLVNVAASGQIIWQKGFDDDAGNFPANCFSAGSKSFNIFMSNNRSFEMRLLITDATGTIDCVNVPSDITVQSSLLNYSQNSVVTNPSIAFDDFIDHPYPFKRNEDYPLLGHIDCQQTLACCVDVVDSSAINKVTICEGTQYLLPDSTIIKDSGNYYVTYKTLLGCDSIVFYSIRLDKDVAALSLGADSCLTQSVPIRLNATAGYEKYKWMANPLTAESHLTISHAGNYQVTVTNTCGSKTDSITIFDQCDYEVFMPKAFTPNNDNLNDYYRIPPMNKNKLIRFRIYNRWGKLVFETSSPAEGWSGNFRNEPLPTDAFVYYLEMEGYSGKRTTHKGSFLLIR